MTIDEANTQRALRHLLTFRASRMPRAQGTALRVPSPVAAPTPINPSPISSLEQSARLLSSASRIGAVAQKRG